MLASCNSTAKDRQERLLRMDRTRPVTFLRVQTEKVSLDRPPGSSFLTLFVPRGLKRSVFTQQNEERLDHPVFGLRILNADVTCPLLRAWRQYLPPTERLASMLTLVVDVLVLVYFPVHVRVRVCVNVCVDLRVDLRSQT